MECAFRPWAVLAVCLVAVPLVTSAAAPPSAELFGALPQTDDVVLSPDGDTVAWNTNSDAGQRVVMVNVATGKDRRVAMIPAGTKLRALYWSDNDTLLLQLSATEERYPDDAYHYETLRTVAFDLTSGQSTILLRKMDSHLLATHAPQPKTVIMAGYDLFAVDVRTGEGKAMKEPSCDRCSGAITIRC